MIYIPPDDVVERLAAAEPQAHDVVRVQGPRALLLRGDRPDERPVAWTYRNPSPGYEALRDFVAFYPGRVDAAYLDDERVEAQESDFYGGWITSDLVGPFKGPAELGW